METAMSEDMLLVERDGPVAILTMNRPKQLNALSIALRTQMVKAIRELRTGQRRARGDRHRRGARLLGRVDLKEAGQSGFVLGAGKFSDGGDLDLARAFGALPVADHRGDQRLCHHRRVRSGADVRRADRIERGEVRRHARARRPRCRCGACRRNCRA